MENQSPPTEDHRASDKNSTGVVTIIVIAIIAILAVAVCAMFFAKEQSHTVYTATTSTKSSTPTTSGTYLKLSVTPDNVASTPEEQAIACAEILKKKFASAPYSIDITPRENFIELEIASTDPATIKEITDFLALKAKLSIHLVHRQSRELADAVATKQKTIPDYTALPYQETDPSTGRSHTTQVLIRTRAELTHLDVKYAYVSPQDYTLLNIELDDAGGEKMHNFTKALTRNVDMIATVLNGEVVNYATLNADSLGKRFVISGLDSKAEAEKVVKSVQSPLTSTLKIIEQDTY